MFKWKGTKRCAIAIKPFEIWICRLEMRHSRMRVKCMPGLWTCASSDAGLRKLGSSDVSIKFQFSKTSCNILMLPNHRISKWKSQHVLRRITACIGRNAKLHADLHLHARSPTYAHTTAVDTRITSLKILPSYPIAAYSNFNQFSFYKDRTFSFENLYHVDLNKCILMASGYFLDIVFDNFHLCLCKNSLNDFMWFWYIILQFYSCKDCKRFLFSLSINYLLARWYDISK